MLDMEHWDSHDEKYANLFATPRGKNAIKEMHKVVYAEATLVDGSKTYIHLPSLATHDEQLEVVMREVEKKNENALMPIKCVRFPYKVKKEKYEWFELPFDICYANVETPYDLTKAKQMLEKWRERYSEAIMFAEEMKARNEEAYEGWKRDAEHYKFQISRLEKILRDL